MDKLAGYQELTLDEVEAGDVVTVFVGESGRGEGDYQWGATVKEIRESQEHGGREVVLEDWADGSAKVVHEDDLGGTTRLMTGSLKTAQPKQLPILEIEGTKYYLDARLEEARAMNNPHERIKFDDMDPDMFEQQVWPLVSEQFLPENTGSLKRTAQEKWEDVKVGRFNDEWVAGQYVMDNYREHGYYKQEGDEFVVYNSQPQKIASLKKQALFYSVYDPQTGNYMASGYGVRSLNEVHDDLYSYATGAGDYEPDEEVMIRDDLALLVGALGVEIHQHQGPEPDDTTEPVAPEMLRAAANLGGPKPKNEAERMKMLEEEEPDEFDLMGSLKRGEYTGQFVIVDHGSGDVGRGKLFWSSEHGWGDRQSATVYPDTKSPLPSGEFVQWMRETEASLKRTAGTAAHIDGVSEQYFWRAVHQLLQGGEQLLKKAAVDYDGDQIIVELPAGMEAQEKELGRKIAELATELSSKPGSPPEFTLEDVLARIAAERKDVEQLKRSAKTVRSGVYKTYQPGDKIQVKPVPAEMAVTEATVIKDNGDHVMAEFEGGGESLVYKEYIVDSLNISAPEGGEQAN